MVRAIIRADMVTIMAVVTSTTTTNTGSVMAMVTSTDSMVIKF